jgi:peptidoglycan/LPS O-acetylase OafA/YrhL
MYLWVGLREIQKDHSAYTAFDRLVAWLSLPTAFGGSAVMLFFVVSGFCVHLPYATATRPFNLRQYALRRAFRILPPYLFAVVFTCLLEWLVYMAGGEPPTPSSHILRVALLSQNYGATFVQLATNGALWSLPVEVELYFAYLAFYILLRKAGGTVVTMIVAGASLAATMAYLYGIRDFGGNFLRFWLIWCAGAFLAEWMKNPTLRMPQFRWWNASLALVFAGGAVWGELRLWPLGILQYLWAVLYFHLVWLALLYPRSIYWFPRRCVDLFVWLGKISYSAYLIHCPIFAACGFFWVRFLGQKPANFLVPLFFSLAVWPVAWVFWRLCESPFHQLSQSLAKRSSIPHAPKYS